MPSAYELLGVDMNDPVQAGAVRDFNALADVISFLVGQRLLRYPDPRAFHLQPHLLDEVERVGGNPGVRVLQLYARLLGFELQLNLVPVTEGGVVDITQDPIARFLLGSLARLAKFDTAGHPTVVDLVTPAEQVYPAARVRDVYWALQAAGVISTDPSGLVSRIPQSPRQAAAFQQAYGVRVVLQYANGHESVEPLRLSLEDWQTLRAAGLDLNLTRGYTAGEAAQTVSLALPLVRRWYTAFLATPGTAVRLQPYIVGEAD